MRIVRCSGGRWSGHTFRAKVRNYQTLFLSRERFEFALEYSNYGYTWHDWEYTTMGFDEVPKSGYKTKDAAIAAANKQLDIIENTSKRVEEYV